MTVYERRLLSFDATPLHYRRFTPEGLCAASVLIAHGMGEHGGRYTALAQALCGAGIDCLVPDLRGYGQSAGRRGHVRRLSDFRQDLEVFTTHLEKTAPSRPLFVLGHSFGGWLASDLVASSAGSRFAGLILSSPLYEVALAVPAWKKILARTLSQFWPVYTQRIPLDPQRLTHDPIIRSQAASDPLIHYRISCRLFSQLDRALEGSQGMAPKIKCPVLMLTAGDDRVVSVRAAERFFSNLTYPDKSHTAYPGLYHEILNESGREAIFSHIAGWIIERSR